MATLDTIERLVRERFGAGVEETACFRGELTVRVSPDAIVEVARFLRDHPALRFNYLSDLTAVDYLHLGRAVRFDVVYHLLSLEYYHRLRVKVAVPELPGRTPSVVAVWPAADAHEREVFDMFGIVFDGHPALERILMPDDWEGHPLRKDFPIGGARSFYFKRDSQPWAGEPAGLVPRIRLNDSDV